MRVKQGSFKIGEKNLRVDFGKRGRKTGPPRAKPSSQVGIDWKSVHIRLQWWEALSMIAMHVILTPRVPFGL